MQRSSTTFILSGKNFLIPGDFLKAKPLPNDPPGSIVFEKDTEVATNILMFFFIEKAEAMPFDDRSGLIDCLHHCLGGNQGAPCCQYGKDGNWCSIRLYDREKPEATIRSSIYPDSSNGF